MSAIDKKIPLWACAFFEQNHSEKTSRTILKNFENLPDARRKILKVSALCILRENALRQNKSWRDGAVGLIVALLPKTFAEFESMLADTKSPLWHEVHFALFCALDPNDLSGGDQSRALHVIEDYLMNLRSEAGSAGWMSGDLLGAHWQSAEAIETLKRVSLSAKFVAGRKSALHGLAHAISDSTLPISSHLRSHARQILLNDKSAKVKTSARLVLKGAGCAANSNKGKKI